MRRPSLLPLLSLGLAAAPLFGACKDDPSDEDQIRAAVDRALAAVNDKRPADVVEDAAEAFRGPRGMSKVEVRRSLVGYLITQKWLKAFGRGIEIEVKGDTAHVDLEVLVAEGNKIEKIEDVLPTNGTVLDMDLELERQDGEWRFVEGAYTHKRL